MRLRFNEAGADCPGMRWKRTIRTAESSTSFNEAGADCPGMPDRLDEFRHGGAEASMRPGQTAPECRSIKAFMNRMLSPLQ